MGKWLRSPLVIVSIVLLMAFIVLIILGYWFQWSWTGFPAKTVWDWLNLLGVLAIPIVAGFGVAWYTTQQGKGNDRENTDNQREAALQTYIDKMSELLLERNLRKSVEDDEVRKIARVRTLTTLKRINARRKGNVVEFLQEAGLIDKGNPIIMLAGADLSYAHLGVIDLRNTDFRYAHFSHTIFFASNLSHADLSHADFYESNLCDTKLNEAKLNHAKFNRADLRYANFSQSDLSNAYFSESDLSEANLFRANIRNADFSSANLSHVNFSDADLSGAYLGYTNLTGAIITPEQLEKAKSLEHAIMPDGSKHP